MILNTQRFSIGETCHPGSRLRLVYSRIDGYRVFQSNYHRITDTYNWGSPTTCLLDWTPRDY